ncbi:MAG: septum formation initiator family protein [Coriobacteriia bacterium]
MTAARRTKNGARADARRTSSTRKAPTRASRRALAPKRNSAKRAPARRQRTDHRAVTLILIASVMFAAWALYPVIRLQYQQQREKATLEQELASLQARNATLRSQVDRLKTPEGVEEVARESLGLVKEGEQMYVVTDGEPTRAPAPDVSAETRSITTSEATVWTEVLDILFGVK